jgi:hypothetical protein
MSGVFTIGGNLFEVLKQENPSATIKMTIPPAQPNYLREQLIVIPQLKHSW